MKSARLVQSAAVSPLFLLLGNGCHFRPLWESMSAATAAAGVLAGFELTMTHVDAPLPSLLSSHIVGRIVKPSQQ